MPILSVILPIKNDHPAVIQSCINSLKRQTFRDFELIIIDDSDNESTVNEINSISGIDLLIIRENRIKKGLSSALNRGIQLAQGKYIARVDADDIQLEDRFLRQFELLSSRDDLDVIGCNTNIIDASDKILGVKKFPECDKDIKQAMSIRNTLSHPTLMLRKDFFEVVGYYDESLKRAEDYALWLKARSTNKIFFYNIQDSLVHYRVSNIEKRDKLNWTINLRLKVKYFKVSYLFSSVLGICTVLIFLVVPESLKASIYKKYTTW